MKKFSALLLTGIIGTSMLFAGFTGSADFEYKLVDLDKKSFTMTNSPNVEAAIELHASTAEKAGEGDIYAEINAKLTVKTTEVKAKDDDTAIIVEPKITDANIVGDGWKVSILGPKGPVNYAKDMIALDKEDDAYDYSIADPKYGGLAVTLDDLGTASIGYAGDFNDIKGTKGYLAVEAAELEVAEGMKAQMGASAVIHRDEPKDFTKFAVAGSAKVAYEREGYSASLAADLGYDGKDFGADVAMNSTSKYAVVDAYYGTKNTNTSKYTKITNDNLLNARVVSDLKEFDVPVKLTLTGVDLINIQDLSLKADVTVNEELSAYVSGGYVIDTKAWKAGAGATYKVTDYTAKLDASFAKGNVLAASASVESETLINGATLKLAWANGDDLTHSKLGDITASCKIAF